MNNVYELNTPSFNIKTKDNHNMKHDENQEMLNWFN